MNLQGHGSHSNPTPAHPAKPAGGKHSGTKPTSHNHHVKRTPHPARSHKPASTKRTGHKSAPRGSLPVTETVQAMQWFVAPASC